MSRKSIEPLHEDDVAVTEVSLDRSLSGAARVVTASGADDGTTSSPSAPQTAVHPVCGNGNRGSRQRRHLDGPDRPPRKKAVTLWSTKTRRDETRRDETTVDTERPPGR